MSNKTKMIEHDVTLQAKILIGELASQFSVIHRQIDDPFLVSNLHAYYYNIKFLILVPLDVHCIDMKIFKTCILCRGNFQ